MEIEKLLKLLESKGIVIDPKRVILVCERSLLEARNIAIFLEGNIIVNVIVEGDKIISCTVRKRRVYTWEKSFLEAKQD